MLIFTSYFYQVRFFDKYLIPLSTALYDPKWFHDNKGDNYVFKDKNGVYNGLRFPTFNPSKSAQCKKDCELDPHNCSFIKSYSQYLDSLDFDKVYESLEEISKSVKSYENLDRDPSIVLLVHEVPTNACSERMPLQKWFRSHDMFVAEWMSPNPKKNSSH